MYDSRRDLYVVIYGKGHKSLVSLIFYWPHQESTISYVMACMSSCFTLKRLLAMGVIYWTRNCIETEPGYVAYDFVARHLQ